MMCPLKWLPFLLLLYCAPAYAQHLIVGGVIPAVPGSLATWINNGSLGTAEGAAGCTSSKCYSVTGLGITGAGTPFCLYDAFTDSQTGFHQLCFSADSLGGGLISYNAYGGATDYGISLQVNGTVVSFISPTGGFLLPSAAGTLTGTTLASNVVNSSLTSLGTLTALNVGGSVALPNGSIANAMLANSNMTVAGVVCALGGSCALSASDLSNGVTGSGSVVLAAAPTFTGVANFSGGLAAATAAQVSGTVAPHVPTEAALAAAATTQYPNGVWRDDYASGTGAMALFYVPSGSACSLNSGAGDGGSQVPSADSKCWLWRPPPSGVTPLEFGAVGNGSSVDTTPAQAWLTAISLQSNNTRGVLDCDHVYKVGALSTSGVPHIEGCASFGVLAAYNQQNCTSVGGFVPASATTTILTLTGPTYVVKYVCFGMATSEGTQTGGAAISLGNNNTVIQSGGLLDGVVIINPYDGVWIDSDSGATQLASQSTTINNGLILNPSDAGVVSGLHSYGDGTGGQHFVNLQITCDSGTSGQNATGIKFYDGDIDYDGTDLGPEHCANGITITPGTYSSEGQNFGGHFKNVEGDSTCTYNSGGHSLLIQPATTLGIASNIYFNGAWASGGTTNKNCSQILVSNANAGLVSDITFNQMVVRSAGSTAPLVDIEGGYNISFLNGEVCSWNNGTVTTGIQVGFNTGVGTEDHILLENNQIGNCAGSGNAMTNGITIVNSAAAVNGLVIQGNNLSEPSTPINYTTGSNDTIIIAANDGLDDQVCTVASAATITIPADCPNVYITGTTTISTIHGYWNGRAVNITPGGAWAWATGGNIVNSGTASVNVSLRAFYVDGGVDSWTLK